MNYRCPVCLYDRMPYPPRDYHICPCCGTEFGNDDAGVSHEQLRREWITSGAHWFYGHPPQKWNPWLQLIRGGHPEEVPFRAVASKSSAGTETTIRYGTGIFNVWAGV